MEIQNDLIQRHIKVLLIDDDEDEYIIIKNQLSGSSDMSFEVSWASNYYRAEELVSDIQFDVCLVDFALGEKDGIELIREFKKKDVHIPFILLTGKGDHRLDMLAMLEGAVDYLEKYAVSSSELDRSIRYAVQNQRIIEELRQARERQEELAKKILESQEKEREFVARDLHDSIGTSLSAVHFALGREIDLIKKSGGSAVNSDGLNRINDMLVEIIEETRRISGNLRPSILDNLGVLPAIGSFVRQFHKVYQKISFNFSFDVKEEDIPDNLKIIFYRIVQESLTNAAKHSQGSRVDLVMSKDQDNLLLDITDDGKGFDIESARTMASENKNMGLEGMIERVRLSGGEISVSSETGMGTRICARFPIVN